MARTGFSVKNSRASSTGMARASTMFFPRRRYCRTSSVYRRPSHTSHTLTTSAMKPRLVYVLPSRCSSGRRPRVRAEQGWLDAVRLRERRPDRVEDAGVRRRVRAARATDRRLVDDRHRWVGAGQAAVDQRALAGACDAGHRHQHAERHIHGDVPKVVEPGFADRDRPAAPWLRLQLLPDVEVAAGGRRRGDEPVDRALVHDGAAVRPGAGAISTT